MIAYLAAETGGDLVREFLEDADVPACAHVLNLAEVFYHYSRASDVLSARQLLAALASDGVQARADLDTALWEDAAQLKADWQRVSLADCFGVALARRLGADFVTTDHHELDALDAGGVCSFIFIR
jgi:predicted nucleic acid-binding protein